VEIVSYNIQFGRGLDRIIDLERICRSIEGADIICLQEVEVGWRRSGGADQPKLISEILPEYYTVFGSSFDVDNSVKNGDGKVVNRRRQHGVMILSAWPILSSRTFNLTKLHYADKFNMQMSFVEAVIKTENKVIRVYNYHAGYLEPKERLEQVKLLARVYQRSPREHGAWSGKPDIDDDDWSNRMETPEMPDSAIVCGDFNFSPDSSEYRYLIENSDLVDCWSVTDPDNLNTSTRRRDITEDIKVAGKIDHIFVSQDLEDTVQRVMIDHEADGSDHKPVRCFMNGQ
jgi:endonuclease/exonuclease/phosphatase family metal-dependent hydrolase